MKSQPLIWPALYVVLGVAAAVAARTFMTDGSPMPHDALLESGMIYIAMPLFAVFAGISSYLSLGRRCTPNHLTARIWSSPPTNPQSNRLAQIIGFGCFGISAVSQRPDAPLRVFGWLGISTAVALTVSLILFRAINLRRNVTTSDEKSAS
jgi:hypothetical protein